MGDAEARKRVQMWLWSFEEIRKKSWTGAWVLRFGDAGDAGWEERKEREMSVAELGRKAVRALVARREGTGW